MEQILSCQASDIKFRNDFINYYIKYGKDRTDKIHNSDEQKRRMIEQHKKERSQALNSDYLQLRLYIVKNEINMKDKMNKCIKRWIYALKEIK